MSHEQPSSLKCFIDDLAVLGRIRLVFRVHGGLGDISCSARDLVIDDGWLVLRNASCTLQLSLAGLASAEVMQATEDEHDRGPLRPCVWFYGACGVPCLGIMAGADRENDAETPRETLATLRARWVGRIVFARPQERHAPDETLH